MLEVEHPAAKVLVKLAELQDREVGDGTNSVLIVAAELLKRANDSVKNKIHPMPITSGYKVVDAVQATKSTNARGDVKYPHEGTCCECCEGCNRIGHEAMCLSPSILLK